MGTQAPPVSIDFITQRKGIFTDVMQETALTVYHQGESPSVGEVRFTTLQLNGSTTTEQVGNFQLPEDPRQPWVMPRKPEQNDLVSQIAGLPHRISDYGYEVNTGQLVWNRHRKSLRAHPGTGRYPLVWAESIRPNGLFEFKAGNRKHRRYFMPQPNQAHFVTNTNCILLQRTTAKEQDRRLVAAQLPAEFINHHNGVVVENHLNIIKPTEGKPRVSIATMMALLNSDLVDQVFRCINGSVAVSAYELEALPLPPPYQTDHLENLVAKQASRADLEQEINRLYRTPSL